MHILFSQYDYLFPQVHFTVKTPLDRNSIEIAFDNLEVKLEAAWYQKCFPFWFAPDRKVILTNSSGIIRRGTVYFP